MGAAGEEGGLWGREECEGDEGEFDVSGCDPGEEFREGVGVCGEVNEGYPVVAARMGDSRELQETSVNFSRECLELNEYRLGRIWSILKHIRDHFPSLLHLFFPKFSGVPSLGSRRCHREIDRHKYQRSKNGPVEKTSGGSAYEREAEVDETFSCVVRTYYELENRVHWEGVFRQRC